MLEEKQRQFFEICIELHKVTQWDFNFLSYLFFMNFFSLYFKRCVLFWIFDFQ